MVLWQFLMSCVTAAFLVVGYVVIWVVDKPWFVRLVPSPYGRIGWCTLVGGPLLLSLNFFLLSLSYNIFKGTGSPWSVQFAMLGTKWITPIAAALVIWLLFGMEHLIPNTRGEVLAFVLLLLAWLACSWRTPLLGG